ncbi:hypothetical protein [Actinocrispum wychmicini]|uniref:PPE family protein n=1 Tax=Actinocrispum wychmicini TaxID=1213861 RepID=A0A4R2JD64_9PSEU|nr:hypothetical protein [Actinocrispum wychmicini]TCO56012.1 hypothetical protein EV192_107437 [Actinocrispum wychmicini]
MSADSGYVIAAQLADISAAVRDGDWVHPDAGMAVNGVGRLGAAPDPVEVLSRAGIPGLVEQLAPMREAQQWFAGDPAAVADYVQRWRRVAELARQAGAGLDGTARKHTMEWRGPAAEGYRRHATGQHGGLAALAEAADCIVSIVESAGDMAGTARASIQAAVAGCVNDLIGRLPAYYAVLNADSGALADVLADSAAVIARWV